MVEPRAYTFPPRDTGGVLLGLRWPQCIALATGLAVAVAVSHGGARVPVAVMPMVVSAIVAFAMVGGEPLWSVVIDAGVYALRRADRPHALWAAPGAPVCLPGVAPVEVLEVAEPSAFAGSVALVVDRSSGSATVALRVAGRGFLLAERSEQDCLLAAWGGALAGFCVARTPVSQLLVSSWTRPAHHDVDDATLDYGRAFTSSEVIVALTASAGRGRGRRGHASLERAARGVLEEARAFVARLEVAGLDAEHLDAAGFEMLLQRRLGVTDATGSWRTQWDHVDTGDTLHATWSVVEWPRRDVGPAWLERLVLLHEGAHGIAFVIEPVSPQASLRRVERDAVRLATDEQQRGRAGFRIGTRHRRARAAVDDRDAELASGHAEVRFAGVVACAAPDRPTLEQRAREVEQAAAACGLELCRLNGRHDLALGLTLCVGARPARAVGP